MGKEFNNLTEEQLCDLMCGGPEPEPEEDDSLVIDVDNETDAIPDSLKSCEKWLCR